MQILRALVDKLLPLAQHQVLVFETKPDESRHRDSQRAVFVRLTPDRLHRITELWRLVREQRLLYASAPLTEFDHVFPVTFLHQPDRYANGTGELCVDASSLWVRYLVRSYFDNTQVETAELPLDRLLRPELLSGRTVEAPQALDPARLKPYSKRLRALRDVQAAYDLINECCFQHYSTTDFPCYITG